MANDEDFIAKVKEASAIEDVIEGCGFPFQRRAGRYLHAREHDSLVVDTFRQAFWWNSRGAEWCGDVIRWVELYKGLEFRTAVEWLAEQARLPVRWGHVDEGLLRRSRAREDAWQVAMGVWQGWLWKDPEALGYVRGRGWTDEVIREAGLGFTGRRTEEEFREMRGELSLHGVDLESPAAVCVLGFRGDVTRWGAEWGVDVAGESWVEWGMIPGAMGKMRLVYAHWGGGRVRYFSTRRVLGDREFEEVEPLRREGREEELKKEIKKSWNPPVKLGGERQVFVNQVWRRGAEAVVVVEGPADAITLGQWGYASVALCGVGGSSEGLERVRRLVERVRAGNSNPAVYVGLDGDEAGERNMRRVAEVFGPMTRLVRWPGRGK